MSIVNQMLKDLDARCGSATGNQLAALQGLGLVSGERNQVRHMLMSSVIGLAVICAVAIGYPAVNGWMDKRQPIESQFAPVVAVPTPVTNVPEAQAAKAETSGTTEAVTPVMEKLQPDNATAEAMPLAVVPHPVASELPAVAEAPAPTKPIRKLSAQQKADRLFADAQAALSEQDYTRAEVLLRQTLFETPQHHSARAQLAALLTARQNLDAAERLLAQGLQGNEQEFELARPYAQLLVARGALEPALAALNNALSRESTDSEIYAVRGAILHRLDRHTEAAKDYRRALAGQPDNAVWWTGLAIAEEHDQRFQQALAAYRQAARLPMENSLHDYVNQRIQLIQNTDGQ